MKRRGEEFNGTVDWGDWASQDRTTAQLEALGVAVDEAQFDTQSPVRG